MTPKKIESTKWAKEFEARYPDRYAQALEYASNRDMRYFIYPVEYPSAKCTRNRILTHPKYTGQPFSMAEKVEVNACFDLCNEMGWELEDANDTAWYKLSRTKRTPEIKIVLPESVVLILRSIRDLSSESTNGPAIRCLVDNLLQDR